MAFTLYTKQIRCPNCNYEGKAQIQGTGCGLWLIFLGLFLISFLIWPLFLVAGLMFIWLVFKPAKQICPQCKFENPILIEREFDGY